MTSAARWACTTPACRNILKVLNPLFLDDLREKLGEAGDNARMLLNLRKRMSKIRVFDPACGSGNFLVIAYKEKRAIEPEINRRRDEADQRTEIPLTNFRGIELRDFPAEIARLALIIAEYQCDVLYRGQKEALRDFLPLDAQNWITCGNALRLDWLSICPPTGTGVRHHADDLFHTPLNQAQIDFENEGGETYICGKKQCAEQKSDLAAIFSGGQHKNLDYVCGFVVKAWRFIDSFDKAALVTTNSINQGTHVPVLSIGSRGPDQRLGLRLDHARWRRRRDVGDVLRQVLTLVGIEDGEALEERNRLCLLAMLGGPLAFIIGHEAVGIDDGGAALALSDIATEAERLAECEPALAGEAVLDDRPHRIRTLIPE